MRRIVLLFCLAAASRAAEPALADRVGSTGFVQLEADSFNRLAPREQALAYYLTRASIAVDPIVYDQLSRFGLRQKRLLEALMARQDSLDPKVRPRIANYAKLFWASRGNRHHMTAQKFLPEFTFEELRAAVLAAWRAGGFRTAPYGTPRIAGERDLDRELEALRPGLFDPGFEPVATAKSPRGALDILQASFNNFYSGVSLADLKTFHERYPLNSRLVKVQGKLAEEVYRAGTPDGKVKPGLYAPYLQKAIEYLARARDYAEPAQQRTLDALIRYYRTGEPADWLAFGAEWVRDNPPVDFTNGFIEVYADARGAKGTCQSFVSITDARITSAMKKLADNAQYFEDRAPWAPAYKKQGVKPPLAKAVEALIETADFQVSTIGENLPNEKEISEKYGTKSFIFTGSTRAFAHATGPAPIEEFGGSAEEIAIGKKYDDEATDLMTALHEVIGHGSGKLNPRLTHDSFYYLKEYASTLEEARADLVALWSVFDDKVRELGLMSHPDVARALYYQAARAPLVQLRRIPKGDIIEEDHQRDRQLIVNYIMEKTGAIARVERNGKTYMAIRDFGKMRQGVGMLLAELMRIKAEGDYAAAKALVEKYGVRFDPQLRDQVVARYAKLNLPSYWAGINPALDAQWAPDGRLARVTISYPRDFAAQQLAYASMYAR